MNNTKWLSALLAGTALTVASTAAMADSSFLTMQRNAAGEGVTFSVLPTADMPASATSVTISGAVSAHLETQKDGDRDTSISTESDISISASTMTAIGRIGVDANVNLEAGTWSSYVGSLEFSPGATFSGGFGGLYKADGYSAAGTTSMSGVGDANASTQFFGLEYNAGPITIGAKVYDNSFASLPYTSITDRIGFNGMAAFDMGEGISVKVVAAAIGDHGDGGGGNSENDYLVGVQGNFAIDMVSVAVAGNFGKGNATHRGRDTDVEFDDNWSSVTGTVSISPVEGWTFAGSYGYETNSTDDMKAESYTISAKWSPVPQYDVIIAYNDVENDANGFENIAGVGVWWKF